MVLKCHTMKIFAAALLCLLPAICPAKDVEIKLLQTSDIHGNLFPENFITMTPAQGGMSRISTIVKNYREKYGDNVILLDNGDILQGQPSVYYYNYVDTLSPHITAQVMNYMGYDAGNVGNHDVETGRHTLDRWAKDCNMPILGANILDKNTGEPHFTPYKVFERDGVKIAVLGMITPAIPAWLSEDIWEGLTFVDMEESPPMDSDNKIEGKPRHHHRTFPCRKIGHRAVRLQGEPQHGDSPQCTGI